ncbi:DUF2164 domain-containing protein [Candidatus Peregrinibacteria bacterium HGW-Peregrinibacteria-1]|jgi:uncharacterized protein (DUF2164 family)|nr:MAG: DUF2164 domain-containing protein [Candidatus Peregrinibacteria bacterium HGW-Peregrinibacteria-1]
MKKEVQRKWDLLSKAKRKSSVDEIIAFFEQEKSEILGVVAAEDILNFFLQNIGGEIYNRGVQDAKELLKRRFDDLEIDLDILLNK